MPKTVQKNTEEPLVSILVPTYNRRNFLPTAINSLLTQSYKNIEVIVVNDAGEDVSDIIKQFDDKRIKYFVNEKNLDLAGTRNVALKHSTGDYISLLDDDDFYLQYAIEFRLGKMKQLNADVVYTRALQNILEKTENGQYHLKHRQLYWDSPFNKDLILVQNVAPCCCPMFSRKAWENTNYWFKEDLTTSEDWDFWVHLSRKYDFHELKLVDCECTFRTDNSQMTGSRKGYTDHLPELYREWRKFASNENKQWVIDSQNKALEGRGLIPSMLNL